MRELKVAAEWAPALTDYKSLIATEVNVRRVELSRDPTQYVSFRYSLNAKVAGPRLGEATKYVLIAMKNFASPHAFRVEGSRLYVTHALGTSVLEEGEWSSGVTERSHASDHLSQDEKVAALSDRRSVIMLDTRVDAELEREGRARDLVRLIQQARKDAKLHISDRIRLRVSGDAAVADAVRAHQEYVREQTLASELELGPPEPGMFTAEGEVGETKATVALVKA